MRPVWIAPVFGGATVQVGARDSVLHAPPTQAH